MKRTVAVAALIMSAAVLTACDAQQTASSADRDRINEQMQTYQNNQPQPKYDWSQIRQTIIDVEDAQIKGKATTTFFFNAGVVDPFDSCPSIGFPVPSTAQLTSPDQVAWYSGGGAVISQAEGTGYYTGDSSGTNTICLDEQGRAYLDYWEGTVKTKGGPAHWDAIKKEIVMDGAPTATAGTGKK